VNAFALHDVSDQAVFRRWGASAAAILAAHAALIAIGMNWTRPQPEPGVTLPAIMVDMAPVSAAPQSTPLERAPDQLMEQADASPPEPVKQQEVVEKPGADFCALGLVRPHRRRDVMHEFGGEVFLAQTADDAMAQDRTTHGPADHEPHPRGRPLRVG